MEHVEYIEKVAADYLPRRYPRASVAEREKYATDWRTKDKASAGIIADYEHRIAPVAGKRILDAGSGIGGISIALVRAGAQATGVEVDQELHEIGTKNAELHAVSFDSVLYDGTKLPLEDNSFDGAISVSVLEHADDPGMYLSEIIRVLKPGGTLYLAFPNRLWPKETHTGLYFLGILPLWLGRAYISLMKRNPLEDNSLHFYDYWRMRRILRTAVGEENFSIIPEAGESKSKAVNFVKKILKIVGVPTHRALLPHVSVLIRKK